MLNERKVSTAERKVKKRKKPNKEKTTKKIIKC